MREVKRESVRVRGWGRGRYEVFRKKEERLCRRVRGVWKGERRKETLDF